MAAGWPSGSNLGAHARHCVGIRPLLCRHHGSELEIPLCHTHHFLSPDYCVLDCRRMALSEAGFHASIAIVEVKGFEATHLPPTAAHSRVALPADTFSGFPRVTSSSTVCPICQGSGWKSVNGGAAKSVARCDCTIQSRSSRL